MKKKLFVFVVLAMVLVACKPAVKGGETPLELTVDNLAGKWVLDSDSTKWYEFKADKTFTSDNVTTTNNGTFEFEDGKLQLYKTTQLAGKGQLDNAKTITIYTSYIVIDSSKYIK